ncbi:4Fe-4S dicluster domain-containing protein [Pseudomonadota bacterium]|uniref:4Fe-4S dicluster domain-containing protein n=1 Tax=unclassified Shewanella TaxID=196818 RepID=UPI000C865135|nr:MULTISPECIES: 4Fe-4S dicluster domain-containing protein [unclassified Shewanella]MDO6620919.1 4Fe-4S dicluster domain-containing protein [Shewanella sp. 6_MG-2023]MDO6639607.1 4Fe-4S dicluster domain-containing protein [Shewanella sp. 5_MG-2023]MDO6777588.1 4Fe-4S dicluster domain-containing protein [Shewanella sp. 3_MG-2023]PMH86188.1 dimethyl sulfoxide reductase subunit B [Shewanella sp. 10N.286.48.B5]PMH99027.1 dimethyl sulfoxide reductase subunit B [Shewanella sp. 10N.286.48.A6]
MTAEITQYGFYFDTRKCVGCRKCHRVCNKKFDVEKSVSTRRVYKYGDERIPTALSKQPNISTYYLSVSCNHCSEPVCVLACPTGAMHKRAKDGLVHVAQETCVGCGSCARACPYEAPQLDPTRKVMVKCDGCFELIEQQSLPLCVDACPKGALDFGLIHELRSKYGTEVNISSLPSAHITSPNMLLGGQPITSSTNKPKGNMGKRY